MARAEIPAFSRDDVVDWVLTSGFGPVSWHPALIIGIQDFLAQALQVGTRHSSQRHEDCGITLSR